VTVNRATAEGERTIIGSGNLLMAYCHIGHNCRLGDRIVLANSVGVAGHVEIDDRAVIGGLTGIHQFVHIGSLAMVGGMSRVVRDVPPFLTVEGSPCRVRGLNRVGLRRSGIGDRDNGAELKELEEIWTLLYRQGLVLAEALQQARQRSLRPSADLLCRFLEASLGPGRRGPTAMQR
jgi:UDP-N-acetylglucosamine acyltransferase